MTSVHSCVAILCVPNIKIGCFCTEDALSVWTNLENVCNSSGYASLV